MTTVSSEPNMGAPLFLFTQLRSPGMKGMFNLKVSGVLRPFWSWTPHLQHISWSVERPLQRFRNQPAHWQSQATKWIVGSLSLSSKRVESEMRITREKFLRFTSGLSIRSAAFEMVKRPTAAASGLHVVHPTFKDLAPRVFRWTKSKALNTLNTSAF